MERMATLEPLFVDVTWGAGGSTSDLTLAISANAQKYLGVEVLMHLTCTNLKVGSAATSLLYGVHASHSLVVVTPVAYGSCSQAFAYAVNIAPHLAHGVFRVYAVKTGVELRPQRLDASDAVSRSPFCPDKSCPLSSRSSCAAAFTLALYSFTVSSVQDLIITWRADGRYYCYEPPAFQGSAVRHLTPHPRLLRCRCRYRFRCRLPPTAETCLKVEEIKGALNKAREAGIQNILALRGDPAKGSRHARCRPYSSVFPLWRRPRVQKEGHGRQQQRGEGDSVGGNVVSGRSIYVFLTP